MKSKVIFFLFLAISLGGAIPVSAQPVYADPAKMEAFVRESEAFASRLGAQVAVIDQQLQPLEWVEVFGGTSLDSKTRIEHSLGLVRRALLLIEQRQRLSRANLASIKKYIAAYGLQPADFKIANSNFERSLTGHGALSNEMWNARVQLYQSALAVLAFAQQRLGQRALKDGKYTYLKSEDQREFLRLLRLVGDASDREGAAVDRLNAALRVTRP